LTPTGQELRFRSLLAHFWRITGVRASLGIASTAA
jgi:hypothetical protein